MKACADLETIRPKSPVGFSIDLSIQNMTKKSESFKAVLPLPYHEAAESSWGGIPEEYVSRIWRITIISFTAMTAVKPLKRLFWLFKVKRNAMCTLWISSFG